MPAGFPQVISRRFLGLLDWATVAQTIIFAFAKQSRKLADLQGRNKNGEGGNRTHDTTIFRGPRR